MTQTSKAALLQYVRDHTEGLSRGIRGGAAIGYNVSVELVRMIEALPEPEK